VSEKQIVGVLRAVEDGYEASPEVIQATGMDKRWVSHLIAKLLQMSVLDREPKPTFNSRGEGGKRAYRCAMAGRKAS